MWCPTEFNIWPQTIYSIYMNDMCNVSNIVKSILFADNTKNVHASNDISRQNETICCVLKKWCVWFAVNKLTVNITKTNYMLFGSLMLNKEVNKNMQNNLISKEQWSQSSWVCVLMNF